MTRRKGIQKVQPNPLQYKARNKISSNLSILQITLEGMVHSHNMKPRLRIPLVVLPAHPHYHQVG